MYGDSKEDFDDDNSSNFPTSSTEDDKNMIYNLLTQGGYENEKLISISKDDVSLYVYTRMDKR